MANAGHGVLDDHDSRIAVLETMLGQHVRQCTEITQEMKQEMREMMVENREAHKVVLGKIEGLSEKIGDERSTRTNGWIKAMAWALAVLLSVIGYLLAQGLPWAK